jgi:Family of unknown function (DUF6526)
MAAEPQRFSNHARYIPGYHFVLSTILLITLGWQITMLARRPGFPSLVGVLLAVGLVLMYWYMRVFAVTVQDRVIRLEERLRMESLLPADLKPRIAEFTPPQLVALRFASDGELPALARRVLEERIADQKAIKAMIREWRADHLRA